MLVSSHKPRLGFILLVNETFLFISLYHALFVIQAQYTIVLKDTAKNKEIGIVWRLVLLSLCDYLLKTVCKTLPLILNLLCEVAYWKTKSVSLSENRKWRLFKEIPVNLSCTIISCNCQFLSIKALHGFMILDSFWGFLRKWNRLLNQEILRFPGLTM